jgi:hypothetical protein
VTIVLDTNALVQMFGVHSPFLALQRAILDGRVALAFSTAILPDLRQMRIDLERQGGRQTGASYPLIRSITAFVNLQPSKKSSAATW